ncbi:hypothetical protein RHA1_ro11002 (plasmid) [Rhodococcus jostii RHA1]|uniref:Uncharacterized protein n=1 Tax=Rhodococcus jostii (strain RHA1) TaxID=101510 RepID=Q0RVN7_RHOJR|nr:hypothetical protein [Rhodococcus jostii]ABH00649.1 hypothetical protein RHA1_ro11002 [Rhodococcus jostii RHA1]
MTVEVVIVRDPDGPTSVWVFVGGEAVEVAESCIDAGAGWDWEDWTEHRDEMLAGASPAARELLLTLFDGPPGGVYVEGRDGRPWLDPAA